MAPARLEINIGRLLAQCEKMVANDECDTNWRYEQYVKALQVQYETLVNSPSVPEKEKLIEIKRRIDYLQSFLPASTPASPGTAGPVLSARGVPTAVAPVIRVSGQTGDVLAELRHRRTGRQQTEARAQLLGNNSNNSSVSESVEDDFDALMKRHHQMQEKVAEEMLALAKNLKEQSILAKNVIGKDKETLERSSGVAEKSRGRLQVESQRLSEFSARACRCWLWAALALVCATFMVMVVFIRLFGKKYLAAAPPPPPPPAPAPVSPATEHGTAAEPVGLLCGWLAWLPYCGVLDSPLGRAGVMEDS